MYENVNCIIPGYIALHYEIERGKLKIFSIIMIGNQV